MYLNNRPAHAGGNRRHVIYIVLDGMPLPAEYRSSRHVRRVDRGTNEKPGAWPPAPVALAVAIGKENIDSAFFAPILLTKLYTRRIGRPLPNGPVPNRNIPRSSLYVQANQITPTYR